MADHTNLLICILLEELKQFSNFSLSLLVKRLNISKLRRQAGQLVLQIIPCGKHVTEPNLGPLASYGKANLLTPCGKGKCSVYCRCCTMSPGCTCSKNPNCLLDFREAFLKAKWRREVTGYVISSAQFSDWLKWGSKGDVTGLTLSILRLQPVWGLCAHGHQAVDFFH